MPEKPYVPFPTVEPKMTPTPSIRETFEPVRISNAVGEALNIVGAGEKTLGSAYEAVGNSFGKLGATAEHAGTEIFNRAMALKQLENDKLVDDAVLNNHMAQGKNSDEFLALEGEKASPEVYQAYMKKGAAARQAIEDSLPNDAAKKQYRHESMGSMGSEFRTMAKHAATEQKGTLIKSSEASVNMFKDQAGKADNDRDFNDAIDKGKDVIERKLRNFRGWTDEQTKQATEQFTSESYAEHAKVMAQSDPSGAMKFLEDNKDKITIPKTWAKIYGTVKGEQYKQESRNIGDRANENPEAPLQEKLDKADKDSEAIRPGDKELRDQARLRTRTGDELYRKEKKDALDRTHETIDDAIYGFRNPDKTLPTKPEDLEVWPDVKAAYDGLSPHEKHKVDVQLANNAKQDYQKTIENRTRYEQLDGEAASNPYQFIQRDLKEEHIPREWREKLYNEQKKLRKSADVDPKVKQAYDIIRAAGIWPRAITEDTKSDLHNEFMGKLRQAMIAAESMPGRVGPLKEQELVNIGKALMKDVPGSGWFGSNIGAETYWSRMGKTVTEDERQQVLAKKPTASEEEITEFWMRRHFKEEYNRLYGSTK